MAKTCRVAFRTLGRTISALLLYGVMIVTISGGCAHTYTTYTDETMQPLAATANDLARAVMLYAEDHPAEAASLDDQELVQRATAFDPNLLKPYEGLVVRGTADGIILVCTSDGKRGLFEDAECSDKVDKLIYTDINAPCEFTLKSETVCLEGEN
jgi:hypothetical protein